jgi:hypothetical protein
MAYRFHDTAHMSKRSIERDFTLEQALETINSPSNILKHPPRRGNHGGLIWLFFKAYGRKVLVIVAETKKNECWLITGYWQ